MTPPAASIKMSNQTTLSLTAILAWLTAKCGSRSTQSESVKAEISSARGRWSTTACTGRPRPRPLEPRPRPRALRPPRPRTWEPRPRPGDRIPLFAAWIKKTWQSNIHRSNSFIKSRCGGILNTAFEVWGPDRLNTSICSWVYLIFNRAVSSPAWDFLYRSSSASSSSFWAWTHHQVTTSHVIGN